MRKFLQKSFWILANQIGIDLIKIAKSSINIPLFITSFIKFRLIYKGKLELKPCLHDKRQEGGSTKSEYFLQDLHVARLIFAAKPLCHVDVGSRIDGFVSHVASFREIEVFDIRPITTKLPGITFIQADLMQTVPSNKLNYCDSLSCLHAIEHFGLGRYGDSLNPKGFEYGIANMASILKPGGVFYLSAPIGNQRVEFNANWVFNPKTIINICHSNKLNLKELKIVNTAKDRLISCSLNENDLTALAKLRYNLGVFIFSKAE